MLQSKAIETEFIKYRVYSRSSLPVNSSSELSVLKSKASWVESPEVLDSTVHQVNSDSESLSLSIVSEVFQSKVSESRVWFQSISERSWCNRNWMQQGAIVLHAVAGSQVAMDVFETGQVSHSLCHLDAKLHQLTHSRTLQKCQQAKSYNFRTVANLAVFYLSIYIFI